MPQSPAGRQHLSDDGHPEDSGGSRVGHTPELEPNFYPKWNLIWACLLQQNPLHTSQHLSVYLPSLTVNSLRAEVRAYIGVHRINSARCTGSARKRKRLSTQHPTHPPSPYPLLSRPGLTGHSSSPHAPKGQKYLQILGCKMRHAWGQTVALILSSSLSTH